jgi:hypothetical protein
MLPWNCQHTKPPYFLFITSDIYTSDTYLKLYYRAINIENQLLLSTDQGNDGFRLQNPEHSLWHQLLQAGKVAETAGLTVLDLTPASTR